MKIGNELNSTGPLRGATRTTSATPLRSLRRTGYATPAPAKSASADISSPAQLFARAAGELNAEKEVRDELVEAARAQVRDWQGLSDKQLDELANSLLSDLS